ncbi:MAG: hypothetical protein OEU26_22840, partial [Candidatus Tectomicrobia bacterium]|nr:hypothetical protein [Candidatus Tectomicrobia bacterium]
LDLTSLTLDEFEQLVPPFEAAFQAHMAQWRLDGKPRISRQLVVSLDSVYEFQTISNRQRASA